MGNHLDIAISLDDGVPIYRQIANQIRYMIASGLLLPGEEIAPVRKLAMQLRVTPNTVVKAYSELEAAGTVRKRRGAGTYVSEANKPLADVERMRIIQSRVDSLLAEAHQLDFSVDEILALIRHRRAEMNAEIKPEKMNA
jgi:GntR family transcriptional regulator